jgi:mRNA-degrading endonuclease toxin of MazEF toxin-antitoxin module
MKHVSFITCDNLVSIRKTDLSHYVGALSKLKLTELDRALKMALALD